MKLNLRFVATFLSMFLLNNQLHSNIDINVQAATDIIADDSIFEATNNINLVAGDNIFHIKTKCFAGDKIIAKAGQVCKSIDSDYIADYITITSPAIQTYYSNFNGITLLDGNLISRYTTFAKIEINGILKALDSYFESIICYVTQDARAHVFLLGNCVVKGDIIFEGQPGKVLASKSAIINGNIINGELKIKA